MSGEGEYGRCDCCGKDKGLNRKYFYYDVKCDCCGGASKNEHFVIVRYCKDCVPIPPSRIKIVLEDVKPIEGR